MDVRGYIEENAAGFFDALMRWLAIPSNERAEMALLLKGAEAAAYLWDELAAAADDLTVAR